MEKKILEQNDEINIDLQRLFGALWHRKWLILLTAVVCAAVTFAVTLFFVTPQYQSSAMFYVNNSTLPGGETNQSISSADIAASKNLVSSYIVILNTRETLDDIIEYADVSLTSAELKGMITASAVNNTEIVQVTVSNPDPAMAEKLANAIAHILPDRISSVIEGTSAKVVDYAVAATKPSSPNYVQNTLMGFAVGFILLSLIIALQVLLDTTIRSDDDISETCNYPVLTSVPDMQAPSKGSYGYDRGGRKSAASVSHNKQYALIGNGISFAATESYKLLRTKLQFSFADERTSHVIGISSALSGEGKSLSAINLAYTLSQLEKKVIMIDCDMRRPTLAEKLRVQKHPGLSNYLIGQNSMDELIQNCGLRREEDAFQVITAGQNPPNPVELLSSARMTTLLELLRQVYDYIILDLPPVGEVTDALVAAKETDGILLVVRQNYCNRVILGDTVRQFEFVGAKILGFVLNCTAEGGKKYGGYYRRYYSTYSKRYGGKYEGAYAAATKSSKKADARRKAAAQ